MSIGATVEPDRFGAEPLLKARDLSVELTLPGDRRGRAIDHVDLDLHRGEIVGLVGESGSGKTMLALSLIGLLPPVARLSASHLVLQDTDLLTVSEPEWSSLRGRVVSMVFQDPLTALNPVRRIESVLEAAYRRHHRASRPEARRAALAALRAVGVPAASERLRSYPHQLSGGLRQRVLLALALINGPQLLIADEPTTALDATIQAQLLRLLRSSAAERTLLLITHDLKAAADICDRLIVMYAGRIVEQGPTEAVLAHPSHPYTAGLLRSRPSFGRRVRSLSPIPGAPPRLGAVGEGCAFAPRCARRSESCRARPELHRLVATEAACWNPLDDSATGNGSDGDGVA